MCHCACMSKLASSICRAFYFLTVSTFFEIYFLYSVDISPQPANDLGLKSVLYKKDVIDSEDVESKPETNATEKAYRYEVAFDNITSQEEEYTVTISTELNGRTVTQTVEKFPMGQQPDQ